MIDQYELEEEKIPNSQRMVDFNVVVFPRK